MIFKKEKDKKIKTFLIIMGVLFSVFLLFKEENAFAENVCFFNKEDFCPELEKHQNELLSQKDVLSYYERLTEKEKDQLEGSTKRLEARIKWLSETSSRISSQIEETEEINEESPQLPFLIKFRDVINEEKTFKEKEKESRDIILSNLGSIKENLSSLQVSLSSPSFYDLTSVWRECYKDARRFCEADCDLKCKALTRSGDIFNTGDAYFHPHYFIAPQFISPEITPYFFKNGEPDPSRIFCHNIFCWDLEIKICHDIFCWPWEIENNMTDFRYSLRNSQIDDSSYLFYSYFAGIIPPSYRLEEELASGYPSIPNLPPENLMPEIISPETNPDLFYFPNTDEPVGHYGFYKPGTGSGAKECVYSDSIYYEPLTEKGYFCSPPIDSTKIYCEGRFCWDIEFKPKNRPFSVYYYPHTRLSISSYIRFFPYHSPPYDGPLSYQFPYPVVPWYNIYCSLDNHCKGNPCDMSSVNYAVSRVEDTLNEIEECEKVIKKIFLLEYIEEISKREDFLCQNLVELCDRYPDEGFCYKYPFDRESFNLPPETGRTAMNQKCRNFIKDWSSCLPFPKYWRDSVTFSDLPSFLTQSGITTLCNRYRNRNFCSYPHEFIELCETVPSTSFSVYYNIEHRLSFCEDLTFEEFDNCGYGNYYRNKCNVSSALTPQEPVPVIIKNAIKNNDPCYVCDYYSYNYFWDTFGAWQVFPANWFFPHETWVSAYDNRCKIPYFLCATKMDEFLSRFYPEDSFEELCEDYPLFNLSWSQCRDIDNEFKDYINDIPFLSERRLSYREKKRRLSYESFCWISYYDNDCHLETPSENGEDDENDEEQEEGKATEKIIEEIKKLKSYCEFKEEKLKYLFYTDPSEFCIKYKELFNAIEICGLSQDYGYLKIKNNWLCQED